MKIHIADTVDAMASSTTLALTAKAAELRSQGIDVCSFTAGEPDFDTPESIRRAAADAILSGGKVCHYTPAAGMLDLRAAIVAKLKRDNSLSYDANQVIVSTGAKQCVYNAIAALLNPGDGAIICAPYWVSYPEMIRGVGGLPVVLDCSKEPNFAPSADMVRDVLTPNTRLMILNSPGNPSGGVSELTQYQAIYDVLADTDVVVLSDEIYEYLVYDDAVHTAPASLSDDAYNRTLTINGFSKAFAMTGWRAGYAAGPLELIKAMSKLQSHSTSNVTTATQLACMAALEGGLSEVEAMRSEFDKRRKVMAEGLDGIDGISCPTPRGAFYCFANVSGLLRNGMEDSAKLCEKLLSDEAVAAVPGTAFGAPDFVRMSYATSMDTIQKGLERIARFAANA